MKTKLIASVLCAVVCVLSVFAVAGCNNNDECIDIFVPDGAPTLAVAQLFAEESVGGSKLNVKITTGENVRAKIISGEADAAICPTNMAAMLYNRGVEYKLVSANLFGLLYIVGNVQIDGLSGLKGKVVYSISKDNTPEYVFKKILDYNGLEYTESDSAVEGKVALRYFAAASEIIPLLKSGLAEIALLGEPAVTKAGKTVLFDVQALWKQASGLGENYPQAGLFVKNSLIEENPQFVSALVSKLTENERYIAENAAQISSLLAQNGSADFADTAFDKQLIARCNVRCVLSANCKSEMTAYFEAIKTVNPAFALPDDGFYADIKASV
ncbi:MAG: hypothetical protein NC350_05695 [Corallococcus sp.]|nr:hypothetical protein [Corallococcus sp.]